MKKIYLSLLLACFATGLMSQNFVVADYETASVSDVVPSLNKWGTAAQISATVEAVINPTTGSLNSSTKVAKVLPINWDSYLYSDITLPNGKAATEYTHLSLKFYSADVTWKSIVVFAQVGTGTISQISLASETNHVKAATSKWVNISVTLDAAQLAAIGTNSFRLIYGVNTNAGTYYVDNVELSNFNTSVDQATGDIKMINYDLCTTKSLMPFWSRWGDADKIFAEVDDVPGAATGTGNGSSKACKATVIGYDQHLGFLVTLPAGKTIANYQSVTFKAYVDMTSTVNGVAADGQYKTWNIFAQNGTATYFSINSTAPSTSANDKVWTDIVVPIDQTKAAAITGSTFRLILGISTPSVYYWIDDVTLKAVPASGLKENLIKSVVVGSKGAIIVKDAVGQKVNIYNISGAEIGQTVAQSSSQEITLTQGLYIVKVGNQSSKVYVK
jgi:hypothetical protein